MSRSTHVTASKSQPNSPCRGDTRGSSDVTHPPLTPERHAAIVAEITRNNPRAWRVLYCATDYVFDPCQVCPTRAGKYPHNDCGLTLMQEMDELRQAFQYCNDWDTATTIMRSLIAKDEQANSISIGARFGDRIIYGESVA